MTVVARQIVKYNLEKRLDLVFRLQTSWAAPLNLPDRWQWSHTRSSSSSSLQIWQRVEFIINQFIVHCHYHTFWELKLCINVFDILFKCVYKYLCNIVIVKFFYKSNWLLGIECIVKTLYVVTKSAGDVFLILLGVALVRVWLACWQLWREGFKISIYNKWESHWPIFIFLKIFSIPLWEVQF